MSQEDVEIVRRVYDAAARRDAGSVLALYHADVQWDVARSPIARLVGEGRYHGHEGLRRFFRAYHEAWESIEYEPEELIDAGDRVISADLERTRGRASGVETELRQFGVWTVDDGKVTRVQWFATREEAFEAVRLRD
jgi:ketosteroid isomerase-like protein